MLDMVTQIFGKAVRNGSRTASQQQLHMSGVNGIGRANAAFRRRYQYCSPAQSSVTIPRGVQGRRRGC